MNIKEILDDLKKNPKLPWNRKKERERLEEMELDGDDEDDSPSKESFASGSTGPIPGINRKWVRGGAIFLAVIFIAAFMYASNDTKKQDPNAAKQQQVKQSKDIANGQQASNHAGAQDAPDSYEGLINSNKKAAQGKQGNTQQAQRVNSTSQQPAQQTVQAQQSAPASIPRMMTPLPSYSQSYSLPSQAPTVQAAPAAPQAAPAASSEPKSVVDNVKDKFKAAIAFALGENSEAVASGSTGNTPATTTTSAAPAAAEAVNQSAPGSVNGTYSAPSTNTISTGTIIPVMLLTGINTDTPGQVMAQVQSDVYDYSGSNLLIPAGSRLMGTYDQKVTNDRVNITFSSCQMPDGGNWAIGNSLVAVDGAGYTGITGEMHRHTAKKFGSGLLKSALNAISTLGANNVTIDTSAFTDVSDGTIKNTLTVEPGYQFQVYVTNNIAF